MAVISPITGKSSTKLVDKIPVKKIISLYKRDLNMDVSPYFTGLNDVEVYECDETKFRFYYPLTLAGNSEFYEQLSTGNDIYYPSWKWENEIAVKYIPAGSKLLDIGCGEGIFLKGLADRQAVDGFGLELNPDGIRRCKEKGLAVANATIQEFAKGRKEQFDVVTTFQVVEHIPEIGSFLESKLSVLKPGGTMIIGVPYSHPYLYKNDKFDTLNLPPHHMGLWNEQAFRNLEPIYNIKLKAIYISKLHDMLYYLSIQLNCRDKYNRLFHNNKLLRTFFRGINFVLSPFKRLLKGHDIIAVFEKNEK